MSYITVEPSHGTFYSVVSVVLLKDLNSPLHHHLSALSRRLHTFGHLVSTQFLLSSVQESTPSFELHFSILASSGATENCERGAALHQCHARKDRSQASRLTTAAEPARHSYLSTTVAVRVSEDNDNHNNNYIYIYFKKMQHHIPSVNEMCIQCITETFTSVMDQLCI